MHHLLSFFLLLPFLLHFICPRPFSFFPLPFPLPPRSLSIHLLLPSVVDFSLAVAVIRSEIDGPALQSSPPLLLLMDLPARPLESFFEPLGVSYPLAGRLMKQPAGGTVASVFNVFLKAQMSLDVLSGFTLLTRPPWYWVGPLAVCTAAWILRDVDVDNWSLSCGSWRFFRNALRGFWPWWGCPLLDTDLRVFLWSFKQTVMF